MPLIRLMPAHKIATFDVMVPSAGFSFLRHVVVFSLLCGVSSCSLTSASSLTKAQELEICDRHERLEITRAEAVKLLGLPPLTDEEAEGGIAGWLTYCRLLKRSSLEDGQP